MRKVLLGIIVVILASVSAAQAATPDQPYMQAALIDLTKARALSNLKQATPDKGGHRAQAISLVNSAITEVKAGIAAAEGS